jgi:hypothetical protein
MTSEAIAYAPVALELSVVQGMILTQENATLDPLDPGLCEVTRCIDKGCYREAAYAVQRIFATGELDVQLLGYFLYGYFDKHGVAGLAAIFETLTGLIQGVPQSPNNNQRPTFIAFDTTLGWLFGRLLKKLQRHEAARDAVFDDWLAAYDPACFASMEPRLEDLRSALESLLSHDVRSLGFLDRISEWCSHFRLLSEPATPAIAAPGATAAEPAPKENDSPASEEEASDEAELNTEATMAARLALEQTECPTFNDVTAPSTHTDRALSCESASPAWQRLLAALRIFDELITDGDFLRAAIVAEELEERFANFNPRDYFPDRLAPFYRVLSTHIRQLDAIRMEVSEAQWRVLRDHCGVDLAGFRDAPAPIAQNPEE